MLNCTVCGHDNFPFTSSQIYGYQASGNSLQMVSQCHKCGARVAEKCEVCQRLHPLYTAHCPLYGIRIADFVNLQVDIQTRIQVFKDLPESREAMALWARYFYKLKWIVVIGLVMAFGGFAFIPQELHRIGGTVSLSGLMFLLFAFISWGRATNKSSGKMYQLWRDKNPNILEPLNIFVHSNRIAIYFDPHSIYSNETLHNRLRDFLLNRVN